jgi:hypothetical protein
LRQEIILFFLNLEVNFVRGNESDFHSRKKGSQYQTNDDDAYFHRLGFAVVIFEFACKTPAEEKHEYGERGNQETDPRIIGSIPFSEAVVKEIQSENEVNVLRVFKVIHGFLFIRLIDRTIDAL